MTAAPMYATLHKELRPLALPAGVGAIALLIIPFTESYTRFSRSESAMFIWAIFVVVVAGLATQSLAVEYANRTLSLLFSQPVSRLKICATKLFVLALVLLALLPVLSFVLAAGDPRVNHEVNSIGYSAATAAALTGTFWVTIARSSIGAHVFNVTSLAALALVCVVLANFDMIDEEVVPSVFYAYAGPLFLLGLRRVIRLQESDTAPAEVLSKEPGEKAFNLPIPGLRCGRRWSELNILRREIVLQRDAFVIASVLVVIVALMQAVNALTGTGPWRPDAFVMQVWGALLLLPFVMGSATLVLLPPALAFCQEKQLGTHAWSMTLPSRQRTHFLWKLLVSFIFSALLGLALPLFLYRAAVFFDPRFLADYDFSLRYPSGVLFLLGAAYVLGVRASSVSHTVFEAMVRPLVLTGLCALAFVYGTGTAGDMLRHGIHDTRLGVAANAIWQQANLQPMEIWWILVALVATRLIWAAARDFAYPVSRRRVILQFASCLILAAALGIIGQVASMLSLSLVWRG